MSRAPKIVESTGAALRLPSRDPALVRGAPRGTQCASARWGPLIRAGRHVLIAAPTGSGKTLAAFLSAIDTLLAPGTSPNGRGPDAVSQASPTTTVLYVSPLRALANDVQKNLLGPIGEIRALDPTLPDIRVLVRSGDTPQSERARMTRTPPHVLVTTPESLYILLTSDSGRRMLRTIRTVIVDEIHAMLRDKRGSHLALSLERLEALAGPVQRIGLSATQKPLADVGHFLVGAGRDCALVDAGHLRVLDLDIETTTRRCAALNRWRRRSHHGSLPRFPLVDDGLDPRRANQGSPLPIALGRSATGHIVVRQAALDRRRFPERANLHIVVLWHAGPTQSAASSNRELSRDGRRRTRRP